jgi:hypothetical protein
MQEYFERLETETRAKCAGACSRVPQVLIAVQDTLKDGMEHSHLAAAEGRKWDMSVMTSGSSLREQLNDTGGIASHLRGTVRDNLCGGEKIDGGHAQPQLVRRLHHQQ